MNMLYYIPICAGEGVTRGSLATVVVLSARARGSSIRHTVSE